jgi:membrane-bound metal-dependent hydrolase YbcI (DUF457 family)
MADFKTHITASTLLGAGYGAVAHYYFGIAPAHCFVAGALFSVAGMLPDLDSNSSIPQREMLSFVSVCIPMLMMSRFEEIGLTPEHMVFVAAVMYVVIRFGIGGLFRKYTKHRGKWHSIPAALVAGMATYLICLSGDSSVRLFKAWATVLGFLLHLFLDEVYSIDLMGRRIKKSSGTAMKLWGNSPLANLFVFSCGAVLAVLITNETTLMDCCRLHPDGLHDHSHFPELPEQTKSWIEGVFAPASHASE